MSKRYLIVGGAAFIGSHLADEFLQHGHAVRIYDALLPQVHGAGGSWPAYLTSSVEAWSGDVRDAEVLEAALSGVDGVFHLGEKRARRLDVHKVAEADVVVSYVPDGITVARWVQASAQGLSAFYDIDTPVTLAKLARGDDEFSRPN